MTAAFVEARGFEVRGGEDRCGAVPAVADRAFELDEGGLVFSLRLQQAAAPIACDRIARL